MNAVFRPSARNPLSPRPLLAEARQNLILAAPLIAAQLSFVGMHAIDTVMAGRLGETALAAVAVGANAWFLSFVVFMGLFMSVSPIVAQRTGAGRFAAETGDFLRNTLLLAVMLGLVWTAVVNLLAAPVIGVLGLSDETTELAEAYLRTIAWGATPLCLCFALRNGCEGLGVTRVPLVAGVSALVVNALVNVPLIYGAFGWPGLGAVGTAWGTVIAVCAMLAIYALSFRFEPTLRSLRLYARRPRWSGELFEVFRIGAPIALTVVAEAWLFNLGGLLMAHFGDSVVAAHQIAINFASMAFMVPLSIGLATTVRVGQNVGAGDNAAAARSGYAGIGLGAAFALLSAGVMLLAPGPIVGLYTQVPEVAELAVRFLWLAALFQIFDCLQATANGALRGFKDTRVPMIVTLVAYWLVGLPTAALLTRATDVGPLGVWIGFIAGLFVAALGLVLRYRRRSRRPDATLGGSVLMI